jgi:DNA-binding response OmpR family regulator
VEIAADPAPALAVLGAGPEYDLAVIDVAPPARDGLATVRALRACNARVPLLLITGANVAERVRGLDLGADDCLAKPFAVEELLARMRALLRRGPSERPVLLRVADLVLDPATRAARRGTRRIRLSTREFALLEYLMRNRGRVLTRAMIVDHVWEVGFETESNLVDVYVGYVRRKIDGPGERALLQTIRGTGYMLEAGRRDVSTRVPPAIEWRQRPPSSGHRWAGKMVASRATHQRKFVPASDRYAPSHSRIVAGRHAGRHRGAIDERGRRDRL